MTGIYKITNKITGDCYIGQSIDIEKRWKEHINSSKNKNSSEYQKILYRAFRIIVLLIQNIYHKTCLISNLI